MRVRRTVRNARSLLPSRRFPKSAPLSKSMSNPIDLSGPLLCTMSKKGRKFKDDQSYILAASPNTSMMNTGRSEIRALPSNVSEWCLGYIRTLFRLMSRWRIRVHDQLAMDYAWLSSSTVDSSEQQDEPSTISYTAIRRSFTDFAPRNHTP